MIMRLGVIDLLLFIAFKTPLPNLILHTQLGKICLKDMLW